MNYTTALLIALIESKEYRRQAAVYLSGRIKKANQSPGFDWNLAIKGFSLKFEKEAKEAKNTADKEYPNSPAETLQWIETIIYFSKQPYKKE